MYDDTVAMHRQYLEQLPEITEHLQLKLYPKVRSSNEFKNASAHGLPLQKYRPKHPACKDFKQITDDLVALIKEKK
ncbi:ParA family protein, partial [Nostoc commune]|nr:ParA family protein [Nostoc commune BAE]